jgi:hypothetical protein
VGQRKNCPRLINAKNGMHFLNKSSLRILSYG